MSLMDWSDKLALAAGIGVDLVDISQMAALDQRTGGAFSQRTFTDAERELAFGSADPMSFLAGRFAVKEAVFKALAPLTAQKAFDFRCVETLRASDGSPRIQYGPKLLEIMHTAHVRELLVSISNESGFAIAFVVALTNSPAD